MNDQTRDRAPCGLLNKVYRVIIRACGFVAAPLLMTVCGCGQSVWERKEKELNAKVHTYTTTPAGAATTLAKLTVPPGFRRIKICYENEPQLTRCFIYRHLLPNHTMMIGLMQRFGASAERASVACPRPRLKAGHPQFLGCASVGIIGGDRVEFSVTTKATVSSKLEVRAIGGATVAVTVIGH